MSTVSARGRGRPRSFDEQQVVRHATALFTGRGYEATSIDDLVAATGLHRGSLYKAFGSKRGIFLAALQRVVDSPVDGLDLLLVAALELAPHDDDVRALVGQGCALLPGHADALLGRRLLDRAGLTPSLKESSWHA